MYKHSLKLAIAGVTAMLFSVAGFAAGSSGHMAMNEFGGSIYHGKPDLELTAALVRAGGGPADFSATKALTSMLGEKTVNGEVKKLTKQYGKKKVHNFVQGEDAVVADALKHATEMGIKLPQAPTDLKGTKLAKQLVKAGIADDGAFWSGHFYDKLVSHKIHNEVMDDVDNNPKLGPAYDRNVHRIGNRLFYDVAQALGMNQVKLAGLH
jgi:hypothetical protein